MQITFKLYATLTDYLPVDARRHNLMPLDVSSEATIDQIVAPFGIPPKLVHLVLVNGVFIPPEQRASRTLVEGDVLVHHPYDSFQTSVERFI